MRLNEAQYSSIKLWNGERSEPRPASEASPFSFKCFAGLSWNLLEIDENLMQSAGSCRDMLGIAVQCWNLLRSVPKLINSKARFPFFVRQVSKKRLECVHVCKVSHPKGPPKHIQFTSCCYGGCRQRVSSFGGSP